MSINDENEEKKLKINDFLTKNHVLNENKVNPEIFH